MDELVPRFVVDKNGKKIGESISVDGKRLIIKNKSRFYSIPISLVEEKFGDLSIHKKVDWGKAGKLGERWREKSFDLLEE